MRTPKTQYYKIGYISPRLYGGDKINRLPTPICYPDLSCKTKFFSMCKYPTYSQARPYFPRYDATNCCDKYLFTV